MRSLLLFTYLLTAAIGPTAAFAQSWQQILNATAGDRSNAYRPKGTTGTKYGESVCISGDYAIVGAPGYSEASDFFTVDGTAYILKKVNGTWKQIKLLYPEADMYDEYTGFGTAVAIHGEYAAVSAPLLNADSLPLTNALTDAGAVYIFKKDLGGPDKWGLLKKVTASFKMIRDEFGNSLSLYGDYLVVGAKQEDENSQHLNTLSNAGAAYIFRKDQGGADNWGEIRKITAPDRAAGDFFGHAVSVSDSYIVVGAPNADNGITGRSNSGAAYIFRKDSGGADNWGFSAKVQSDTSGANDYFGYSVAVSGNSALVGSPGKDRPPLAPDDQSEWGVKDAGAIFFFDAGAGTPDAWSLTKAIASTSTGQTLGLAVSMSGDYAVIGAPYNSEIFFGEPSVYVYRRPAGTTNWNLFKRQVRGAGRLYGVSISLDGDKFVTGSSYGAGSVYLHEQNATGTGEWGQRQQMEMYLPEFSDGMGGSVSIHGNTAAVGAPGDDENAAGANFVSNSGSVYLFAGTGGAWQQIAKITAPVRVAGEGFGSSVVLHGDYLAVSAPGGKAVYVFARNQGGVENWGLVKKIVSPNAVADGFGSALAFDENYLVAGAPTDSYVFLEQTFYSGGSAYVFGKNEGGTDNWGLIKRLQATNHSVPDQFGAAVALSGNFVIAGAPMEDEDATEANPVTAAGAAYLFNKDTGGANSWGLVKKLAGVAGERDANANFGSAVAMAGADVFVGAPQDTYVTTNENGDTNHDVGAGAIHVFNQDQNGSGAWGLRKKIGPPPAERGGFGRNLAVSGDYMATSRAAFTPAAVQLFKRNTGGTEFWGLEQSIPYANNNPDLLFGRSLALFDDFLIIGDPGQDYDENGLDFVYDAGGFYVFKNDRPLPVTLASFQATKAEGAAHLSWKTASETNAGRFEIQRSTDGKIWGRIGEVAATGSGSGSYQFTDHAPLSGQNLYRLKMMDLDETFAYSAIKALTFGEGVTINVFPNPVAETIYMDASDWSNVTGVQLADSQGRLHYSSSALPGKEINAKLLNPGIYIVRILLKNGTETTRKVIVAR